MIFHFQRNVQNVYLIVVVQIVLPLLQQAKENSIKKLDLQEAFMRLVSGSFLLPLNEKMTDRFLDIASQSMKKIYWLLQL
jgi:hypothetical protein